MGQITARTRVVFGQTCLLVSILLVAIALQLVPERKQAVIDGRATLCENIAVSSSHLVAKNELRMVGSVLQAIVDRNPDVLSVAVRRTRGQLLIEAGDHEENWNPVAHGRSDESNVFVPVYAGAQPWGSVEACFATLRQTGFMGVFNHRWARFVVFVSAATYLAYSAYLAKMLAQPVPSRAVPHHVRETLNTFAEELIMIDTRDRILFTNESFSGLIGTSSRAVTGRRIGLLDWLDSESDEKLKSFPWSQAIQGRTTVARKLRLRLTATETRVYVANCSPVCGSGSEIRGALICLEDVTELERNRRQPGTANVTADRPAAASPLPAAVTGPSAGKLPDDAADPSTIGRLPPSTLGTSTTPRADSSRPRAADPVRSSLRLEDPGFLEIVAGFVGHLSDKLHEIRTFWEVQDLNQLARLAHWLKGAGGTMGFNQFHAPALHLEWLANNRRLDEIPAVIAQLEDLAARIEIPAIESVIPETDPVSQVD